MPTVTVALKPGVDVEKTDVLNAAGISVSQLIRFRDGLTEKIGGWEKFYVASLGGIPRALHAWQDLNEVKRLGVGTTTQLVVGDEDTFTSLTPQIKSTSTAVNFSTTAASATVTITDTNISNVTVFDTVYFKTPVAVGGLILSGVYPVASVAGATSFRITAPSNATVTRANATITGATQANPCVVTAVAHGFANGDLIYIYGVAGMTQLNGLLYTIANITANTFELSGINSTGFTAYSSGGTASPSHVPVFTTTNASATVAVTLKGHGLAVGDSVNFAVSTTVGGVTISGTYSVTAITSVNIFAIIASVVATSTTTGSMNAGLAAFDYYIAIGPETLFSGYSIGTYSSGGYSTGTALTSQTGTPITALDWSLDNWGEIFLSCPEGGAVYYWQPNTGFTTVRLLDEAPIFNQGIFVSQQAQILVAYGSSEDINIGLGTDPLLVKWSAQLDYTDWTVSTASQAGFYRIPTGSTIVGGMAAAHQDLIWTDLDLYAMSYLGFPLVFGFEKIGSNCGLAGKHAAARAGSIIMWMGISGFYALAGNGVAPVPCPVWDVVFQDIDTANRYKVRSWVNSPFNEIWWFYPSLSGGTGENDKYVKFNLVLGVWDYGSLGRSAGIDQSVFGMPIAASSSGVVYQHETGRDDDGASINAYFESGWFALSDGQDISFVDWMLPDMKWGPFNGAQTASVQITLYSAMYPGDTPRTYGPYSVGQATKFVNTRLRGRLVKFRAGSGDTGSFWRMGGVRLRIAADGRR